MYLAGAARRREPGRSSPSRCSTPRTRSLIIGAITIGLCFHALMYAGQPAIMAEMFPTRMRYSGVSLGYQVTSIVAGSMAPIIAASLSAPMGPRCLWLCT